MAIPVKPMSPSEVAHDPALAVGYLLADLPADSLHVQVIRANLTLDHLVELVDLVVYRWVYPKD